jgi:hypothetical protein
MIKTYAQINSGIVENVILATEEDILTINGTFIECSEDGSIRYNYPSIGSTYDSENDAFILPKPYASWILGDDFKWSAPKDKPSEGKWFWSEESQDWLEIIV